jgi:ABC-type bacteriocin/lantibiotic exporter with double-glycine peptidase domain
MKIQKDIHSCGVMAVLNATKALGLNITEAQVRAHTATVEDGTTEFGIKNALERLGLFHEDLVSVKGEEFLNVWAKVSDGAAVILSVEDYRHWVTVIGTIGDNRVLVFDPWNSKANQAESGVQVCNERQLKRWWKSSKGEFYGIIVRRTKR